MTRNMVRPDTADVGRAAARRTILPGPAELDPARHRRRRRLIETTLSVAVPVLIVLAWQAASSLGVLDSRFYPSPWQIVTSDQLLGSELWYDVYVSAVRMIVGFAIGAVIGIVVGVVTGISRLTRSALEPLLSALYTVPKLALIPVFLTVFGIGTDAPRIALVAVTVFFFVWIATMSAVIAVPGAYTDAAVVFRANRLQTFRHVLLPAATPAVFVGLRIAAGVAVLVLIGVELVLSGDGLGNRIEQGRVLLVPEQTYLGIVLSSVLGVVFAGVVSAVGKLVTPWEKNRR